MAGERAPSQRSRSSRNRRAPKQYEGAMSWEEAGDLVKSTDNQKGEGSTSMALDERQGGDVGGETKLPDLIMEEDDDDEDEGHTSDEFVPDSRKKGDDRLRLTEEDLESNSEEESISPDEGEIDPALLGNFPSSQQYHDLTASQRLDRARKRKWHPPIGHGGMENPEAWRAAGQRNRREQEEYERRAATEVDIEVEDDEIQNLADAFAGDENDATIAQIERWQSALHSRNEEPEEEELDDGAFDQDLRDAVGFKRKTVRDQRTGAIRRAPREQTLSDEIRKLLTEANLAYIEPDLPQTISKLQEVIKLEPAVRSAWATLALCFNELNEPEKAVQSRIMEAHLSYRPIGLWEELAQSSRAMGYNEQAVYCLSKAITSSREKDRVDVIDIMWERGQLLEEMNEPRRAVQSYMQMLHYRPQNQSIIRQMIPLLFQLNLLDRAIQILQQCEEWNMTAFPDPLLDPAMMDESLGPDVRNTYESSEVVTLADLLLRANRPQEALRTIRRGARWLDGRGAEEFWDEVEEDDREFDQSREEGVREGDYGRRVELAPIHYLEPEFRFQMGVARARMGNGGEAEMHFEIWQLDAHISDQLDHYSDMAEEYARLGALSDRDEEEQKKWYEMALEITSNTLEERQRGADYGEDPEGTIADYKRFAACHIGLGQSERAIEWLLEVVQYNPDDYESKLRLAEAYEEVGDRDTAIDLVTQVVRAKRERQVYSEREGGDPVVNDETLAQSLSFFAEIQQKTSRDADGASKQTIREQRKELERIREMESSLGWKRLKSREEKVFVDQWWSVNVDLSGDPRKRYYGDRESSKAKAERFSNVTEWLSDAERLVTMFQSTPQLYPKNRTKKFSGVLRTKKKKADLLDSQATAILARLGDDLFEDRGGKDTYEFSTFRGIKLDDWVTLIMQYAFILTKVGEYDTAQAVLERVIRSNIIYANETRKLAIQFCLASCALYVQDYATMLTEIKVLAFEYQFHNEPLRILLTLANATGYASLSAFVNPNNLKTFLRRSRIHEALVQGGVCSWGKKGQPRWVARTALFESTTANQQSDEGEEDDEDDDGDDDEASIDSSSANNRGDQEGAGIKKASFSSTSKEYTGSALEIWKIIKDESAVNPAKSSPPTKYNPANDMFYASLLLTSTTGVPSMGYWIRIFARQQNDPLICLTAALACFGRAQNRQVDNRHQVVIQGFAFLHHYRRLRNDLGHHTSEISYNFARAFHRLGLYQMTIPHYLEVLQIHEKEKEQKGKVAFNSTSKSQSGFKAWPEAAYNLSLVYLASGNPVLANENMERYLVV